MTRLAILTLSALMIFIGFCLPFVVGGYVGFLAGGLVVLLGAGLFWVFEVKTRKLLEKETPINSMLKADGSNLIDGNDFKTDSLPGPPRHSIGA